MKQLKRIKSSALMKMKKAGLEGREREREWEWVWKWEREREVKNGQKTSYS